MSIPTEKVTYKPLTVKLTPSQRIAFDAMRREEHLSRTQLVDAALATFFTVRGKSWPVANRRTI